MSRGQDVIVSGGSLPLSGGGADRGFIDEATERLLSAAAWFLPSLQGAAVSGVWHGTRARRPSGNPVVRRLAPGVTLFAGLAGRGFLCGPLLAERLATALAGRLLETPSS